MILCPVCHCVIETLVGCLQDRECWENVTIAQTIIENCPSCRELVKEKAAINECIPHITAIS